MTTNNQSLRACGPRALAAIFTIGLIATNAATAQTYTVLHYFRGPDGTVPVSGLLRDPAGNLFGTTNKGGAFGHGVVFRIDATGKETGYSFSGPDGANPYASLVAGPAGNLYGTTYNGGAFNGGVVFKADASSISVLHSFQGGENDGWRSLASVVRDAAGNLYGTTEGGGTYDSGVVFKLDPAGALTVLHSFTGGQDGYYPMAGLILDAAGNLYGTTYGGGTYGDGVVLKLTASGTLTVLHNFAGYPTDGSQPDTGLIRDAAGNLYGTTPGGGASNAGVIYKLDSAGMLTLLHSFTGSDGRNPESGLLRDAAGNLYGTTYLGGASPGPGGGVAFKLDPAGNLTVLHEFSGADGDEPQGSLIRDLAGNLYGTASAGGLNRGVVFKITP